MLSEMYDDLEPIAELKITKVIEESTANAERRLGETRNQMTARGKILSGAAEQAEFDIQAGTLEKVARTIADTWVDLLTKRSQELTRDDLTLIMQKVERYTFLQARNLGSAMLNRPGGSIVATGPNQNFWHQQADTRMRKVAGDIRRDLEIRFREQEAFPRVMESVTMPSPTYLNIQNANISNLNLGTQVGTINTALQVLTTEDHKTVAEAIKELTEGVLKDGRLGDSQKQEAVEALSTLASEAQRGQGHASISTKALIGWLPTLLGVSADLVTLWDKAGPTLRAFFGL